MTKEKKLKVNFVFRFIWQVTAILVSLVMTSYIARKLGPTELGNYSYTYSILTYFGLIAVFGFNIYGTREIAKVRDDKYQTSKVFFEIMIAKTIPCLISIAGYFVMGILYKEFTILFICLSPFLIYYAFDITFLIYGDENFKFITVRDFVLKIICVILIFIFVKEEKDVWIYAIIMSVTMLGSGLIMLTYLNKRVQKVPFKELNVFIHLKRSAVFLIPAFATSVFLYVDKIMIKLITGSSSQVAFYEESIKLIMMLVGLTTVLANVIDPRNANEFAKGNIKGMRDNTIKGLNYTVYACLPMAIGLFAIAPIFCPFFFGEGYDDVILILQIMCLLVPVISVNEMLGITYLIPSGREKLYSTIILGCSLLNVALNVVLIIFFGAIGAAVATLVAECVRTLVLYLYLRKEVNFLDVIKTFTKKIISAVVMGAVIIPLSYLVNKTVPMMIILIFAGVVIYVGLETILKDREMMNLYNYAFTFLKKLRKKENTSNEG